MAIAFLYNPVNYKLVGSVPMQKNPMRAGEFLIPANSTTVDPPSGYTEDQIPAFNTATNQWYLTTSDYAEELENNKAQAFTPLGSALYVKDDNDNWIARNQAEVDAEDLGRYKEEEIRNIKEVMDNNIINEALAVTGASTIESAQAFVSAFALRAANPSDYFNDGLQVFYAIDVYNLGDTLDTEAKVADYYNKVSVYLDKFRNAEIATYIAARNAINALTEIPS